MIDRNYNNMVKEIRAQVIKDYLNGTGRRQCVCFSCGNASAKLKEAGLEVAEVINPDTWWTPEEIRNTYHMFDATSGHLPFFLMKRIAAAFANLVPTPPKYMRLATGSGETYVIMKMAYPYLHIIPVYNIDLATKYNEHAPLNGLVKALEQ